MDLAAALKNIRTTRKAVLFLGAGFSNDAKNVLGLPTPSAAQLSDRILERLGIPGKGNLGLAVDKLREKLSPAEGFEFISNQLTVRAVTPDQAAILALPWARIYTTNVDNVGSVSGRVSRDAAIDSDPAGIGDYISLHGSIVNCTLTNFYKNLKLGEQLYLSNARNSSGYFHLLKQDLFECDSAFVIGYSMADPDLSEVFFNSQDLLNKCFVFSGRADELSAHRIALIGNDTKLGLADLVKLVHERATTTETPLQSGLVADTGTFDSKEVTQTARQNLLIYGRYDANIARSSWTVGGATYVVSRQIANTLSSLKPPRVAVVHSHLGNGKSLIFERARFQSARQGKKVFTVKSELSEDTFLRAIADVPPGSVVFFEGDIFSVAGAIEVIRDKNLVLCATSRSTTLRVALPALARISNGVVPLETFDANRLTAAELSDFHDLIHSMGFWPRDLSQLTRQKRMERLQHEFDGNVNAILVKIFENEKLREAILAQWRAALASLRPILDHFIVASYMQIIDITVPSYILNEFQHMDFSLLAQMRNDIVSVSNSGRVSFGNSVIGEFVLNNNQNKNDIIGAVVRFANFVNGHSSQWSLQWIVRRLLRYWNLSRLLGSRTLPNEVLDRASYVPCVSADPLFWVQYSIAQMENNNFLPANRYLDTAYARAADRGSSFDTYQIDTHAARLVIRNIMANGIYDGISRDVLSAVSKLRSVAQRRPDDIYHVASVVALMLKSEVNWSHTLDERDHRIFKKELDAIAQKLTLPAGDFSFAAEREALDLVRKMPG